MPRCAPAQTISRRTGLAGLLAALARPKAFAAAKPVVVTVLGDSITAGYGLAAADALPAQLQAALARLGVQAEVRAAGVSGDTTADGLGRVDFSVLPDTRLCLVALGANDLLQGDDPTTTRTNLASIVGRLKARHIASMIIGMHAPPVIGAAYARDFNATFPSVAREAHVPLYPYLLEDVAGVRALNQHDGLHPNPAGVKIIAARMAPAVARALKAAP